MELAQQICNRYGNCIAIVCKNGNAGHCSLANGKKSPITNLGWSWYDRDCGRRNKKYLNILSLVYLD